MSSSKSSQEQSSTYTDNRAVLGQDSNYANNGSRIVNYTLDQEAVNRSLNTVDDAVSNALGAGTDNVRSALNFAGASRDAANDLAGGAVSAISTFGTKVLDQAADNQVLIANAYADAKGQGALTQKILIAAVVGALLVALAAVKKD